MCSKTWHTIVIYSFVCGNMTNSVGVVWFSPHSMGLLMTNLGRQYLLPWNIIYFLKIKCNNLKIYISTKENWIITRNTFCTMGPRVSQAFCTSYSKKKTTFFVNFLLLCHVVNLSPPLLNQSFLFFFFFFRFLCA